MTLSSTMRICEAGGVWRKGSVIRESVGVVAGAESAAGCDSMYGASVIAGSSDSKRLRGGSGSR
jgi:hypothetical protein